MSDSNNKVYVLDSRKVVYCFGSEIGIDSLVSSINSVHDTIVKIYPEARNFRFQFQYYEKDVHILLTFERYETDDEVTEMVEEESNTGNSSIIQMLVYGAIIVFSIIVYNFCSTDTTENTVDLSSRQDSAVQAETQIANEFYQESQPAPKSKYRDITFSNSQDVYNYLNGNIFVSDDGMTLRFDTGGRYLYANGRLLYTDVRVIELRSDKAIIKLNGPYGGSTFAVMLEDYAHYLYDVNDGTTYDGKW